MIHPSTCECSHCVFNAWYWEKTIAPTMQRAVDNATFHGGVAADATGTGWDTRTMTLTNAEYNLWSQPARRLWEAVDQLPANYPTTEGEHSLLVTAQDNFRREVVGIIRQAEDTGRFAVIGPRKHTGGANREDHPATEVSIRAQAIRDAYSAAAQHNLDLFEPRDAITIAHYITTGTTP